MSRVGRRNKAYWRIGVYDSRTRRDGEPIEYIGSYNPHQETAQEKLTINRERVQYWVSKGAQPSEAVLALLKAADKEAAAKA
jgi:small subunit ribosomal protein S16